MNRPVKPLYQSRTLWSLGLGILLLVAEPLGAYIDKARKQGLTWAEGGAIISMLIGGYFRVKSTHDLARSKTEDDLVTEELPEPPESSDPPESGI